MNADEEINKQVDMQKQLAQMDAVVKQHLDKQALSRYGNIKAAQPKSFMNLVTTLFHAIQEKKVTQIQDAMLKELLGQMHKKRTTTIRRV